MFGIFRKLRASVALKACRNVMHPLIDLEQFSCCSWVCTVMQKELPCAFCLPDYVAAQTELGNTCRV